MLHIGKKIKELREKENLSAETLGKKMGISKQSVFDMERKADISTMRLRQLSSIFHVPMTYFVEDDDDNTPSNVNHILMTCRDLRNEYKQFDTTISKLFEMVK